MHIRYVPLPHCRAKKLAKRRFVKVEPFRKSKKEVLNKLASPNTKQNGWWKTLRHFIKPDQTDVIPPLNKNGQIYTEEKEIYRTTSSQNKLC